MSGGSIRVLLLEQDDLQARRLADAIAARGGENVVLARETDDAVAIRRLLDDRFDALLLDLANDGASGLEKLSRLHDHVPDLPIIVLTHGDDEATAVQALKQGAQDSLALGQVDGNLLVRAIRYAIERNQLRMALRAMSLVDDLTGLYNRRGFLTLARQQLKVADRMNKRLSQIFLDLDGLKAINDRFGHREGDRALVEAADVLREVFRDSDILARIGGDEFVVLAIESAGARPETFADRVRERLAALNAAHGRQYQLAVSLGVAHYDPASPCSIDDLLARADSLMYAEKRAKRQRRAGAYGGRPGDPTSYSAVQPRAD